MSLCLLDHYVDKHDVDLIQKKVLKYIISEITVFHLVHVTSLWRFSIDKLLSLHNSTVAMFIYISSNHRKCKP
jgi:hypothetical protein